MPASILPLVEIAPLLPARGSLIGLDLGTKTIGVAASDPDRRLAGGVPTGARQAVQADAEVLLARAGASGLIEADMRRARRAEVIDQHAAAFILQGALDRLGRLKVT